MTRLASFTLLLGLVLPYARMPACASAGHEHPGQERTGQHHAGHLHAGHEPAGPHDPWTGVSAAGHDSEGAGETDDCHRLMACGTTIQGVLRVDAGPSVAARHVPAGRPPGPEPHDAPARAPLSPPPQSA